jgi:hypothetical protein
MKRLALVTFIAIGLAARAEAGPITFDAANGNMSARVSFDVVDSKLVVTLTNTSLFGAVVPTDILTAVFFDIYGLSYSMTPLSALLGTNSEILNGAQTANVGGEWAYAAGIGGKRLKARTTASVRPG